LYLQSSNFEIKITAVGERLKLLLYLAREPLNITHLLTMYCIINARFFTFTILNYIKVREWRVS